jgi:hypothetical protein
MTRTITRTLTLFALSAALVPAAAAAQPPTPPAGLQIRELESGFVIAPDARFTEINDRSATLAGVYGGWLTDQKLLIGAGAYWLANRSRDFEMQYFGGLARWNFLSHRTVGLTAGAFVGFGDGTLSRTYGDLFGVPEDAVIRDTSHFRVNRGHPAGQPITASTLVAVHDGFFITEPQVNAIWNITGWMRVDAGVGYRLIGASDLLGDEFRGTSGSIAIQFGGR